MRRLLEIVSLVDVEVALEEMPIIPLRYADAADLANILNQLFATGRAARGHARRAGGADAAPHPPPGARRPTPAPPPRRTGDPGTTASAERRP